MGPYYAMFPVGFSDSVVERYTSRGDAVLDPFAGRATAVFSAASKGRYGLGIEISPVGWVYGQAKLRSATEHDTRTRLEEIGRHAGRYRAQVKALPLFFRHCFGRDVLQFLLAARSELNWRRCVVDRTLVAFILVYLHGKRDYSLSNQMRQTKAMAPGYAMRWWTSRSLHPPQVDPVTFLAKRVAWRYEKGTPQVSPAKVYLGDATLLLGNKTSGVCRSDLFPAKLLFTSPPYFKLTNYHYDQWLRLWLLGGRADPTRSGRPNRGKFENRADYRALLRRVFSGCAKLLSRDAVVYVRTDRRPETYCVTREVLREVFPTKRVVRRLRPFRRPTQTHLFGDNSRKVGEVDLVLLPS